MSSSHSLKEGDYLFHNSFGVGKVIRSTGGDHPDLTIAFEKDPRLNISAAHAARAVIRLSSRGFRALAYEDPRQAAKMLHEKPTEAVKRVLYDFPDHQTKTIEIREYLSPYLADWEAWWKPTQKLLKESPFIDSTRSKDQIYGLRTEMLSLAEEAFQSFQDLFAKIPASQALTFDDPRYERARQTLIAVGEGFSLTDEQAQELKIFFQRVSKDPKLPKALRIDALYRALEQAWITAEEAASDVLGMFPLEEGLISLSRFAQNRFVEHLTSLPRSGAGDQALLSGLVIPLEAGETIEAWVRDQLDVELDMLAVSVLLQGIEKLLAIDLSPGTLSKALERLNRLLDLAPNDEAFWGSLPKRFHSIMQELLKIPDVRMRRDLSDVFIELMRSAGKLFSRRTLFENGEFTKLQDTLCSWEHPTEVKAALLRGLGESDLPPNFREIMLEAFAAGISTDQDAKLLVEESGLELERLVEYAEYAALEGDFSPLGAAQFLAAVASELDEEELEELLPLLNRMAALGDEGEEWLRILNVHRAKVFRAAIQGILSRKGVEDVRVPGLDPLLLYLFKEQFEQGTIEISSKLDELETELAKREGETKTLERSLQTQKSTVGELGQRIQIAKEEERYKERHKLAGDLVRSVAEMERYFTKQSDLKKEVEAIIIRIHGFLSGFGVEPVCNIGDEIAYDPQLCQLITELPKGAEGRIKVIVRERGYRIRDPHGEMRILKRAIVEPLSK